MISYLEGEILQKKERFIILNVGGVGYKVFLSEKNLAQISGNAKKLQLFCYLNVKENALNLYGFFSDGELDFFEYLIEIPGIGPKAALEITAIGSLDKIREAIENEDESVLKELSRIGKKKSQVLIWQLTRKTKISPKEKTSSEDEAFRALVHLGFPRQRARGALASISKGLKTPEQKIKEALKLLTK